MDFGRFLSSEEDKPANKRGSQSRKGLRRNLPLLASPVNDNLHYVLGSSGSLDFEKIKSRGSIGSISTTSSGNPIIYKSHHEASTIELFYDLFFVANLAYFTAMHQHVDAASVLNYLKLFTLMWFTWLSTILYDVRFGTDSVYNRLCKLVHFGVMTGFVFAGPVFDNYDKAHDQRYYKAFAVVLFVSRIVIAIQYIIVMWQSRHFKRALLPLGLTAGVYLVAAILYLVTHFVFPESGPIQEYELILWFALSIGEGIATLLIAIFWRIISFKYTHLVERMGLLSLILMGEGIIGMVKSLSCITKGQLTNNSSEYGNTVAAVILIYLIWILYFDAIDHHRFGTIRQQIWALLHYPLHIAILLTVEGNTSLIVWNSVVKGLQFVWARQPLPANAPGTNFATSQDFIEFINESMVAIDAQFTSASWRSDFPWSSNLTALTNISNTYSFRSPEWDTSVVPILDKMFIAAEVFVFQAHSETMDKMVAVMPTITNSQSTLTTVYAIFDVVVLYFYVCAGGMLIVLAMMYWFGKSNKSKYEFGEMINRTIIGFIIPIVGVTATLNNKSETGFKFKASSWLIPIVVFGFLIVVVLDNVILSVAYLTNKHRRRSSRWTGNKLARSLDDDDYEDTADLVNASNLNISEDGRERYSSTYSRNAAYQPYDTYGARAGVPTSQNGAPDIGDDGSQRLSRAPTPTPQLPQIPISLIMQDKFRPSHTRSRSGGYAVLNVEEQDDYDDAGMRPVSNRHE